MSRRDKLEQVLEYIINEEIEAASELLHAVVVEQARDIYGELTNEDFGGDAAEDFIGDVSAEDESGESDETGDSEEFEAGFDSDETDEGESEDSAEERIENLEDALADLRAEFDALMSQEAEEPNHDFSGEEFSDDSEQAETDEDGVFESTQFQKEESVDMKGEEGSVNKQSPYTKSPSKPSYGGEPVKFAKPAKDGKEASDVAKKEKAPSNINVSTKTETADMGTEGKFAGTGKGSKGGAVNTKSPIEKHLK